MDRRRSMSPIPPPREPKRDPNARFEDRRPPPPIRGRRPRSITPPRRSPPRDSYKRHRRDDDYYDRHDRYGSPRRRGHSPDYNRGYHDGGGGGYNDDYYHQPPPPPKRGDDRGGGGGPKTFRAFLLEEVPESVTPIQAQQMYEEYLTRHFGDQLRAKFEQEKGQEEVRAAFHPASFEASLARHREDAASSAAVLALEIRDGKLDPARADFAQGQLRAAEGEEAAPAPEGPPCLWKPDRVATDYRAARRLVALVDQQRGLKLADNPLLPAPAAAPEPEAEADGEGEGAKEAGEGAGGAAAGGGEGGGGSEAELAAVLAEVDCEVLELGAESALLERLGQLDLLLTWLWAVHGIDYYGGRELLLEAEYAARGSSSRTIRGPRPEEGEEQDEDEAKEDRTELAARVDETWAARMKQPDPLLLGCQREEIEKRLNDYVESQIKMENEKKWGSTFSNKYFLEKRFVVKHIQNKHQGRLDEQRDVIREELYWAAYEAANKAKHAARRASQKEKEAAAAVAAAGDAHMAEAGDWQEGYDGEEGYVGGPGGRGPGRLGPMRGRGGRGLGLGRGRGVLGSLAAPDAAGLLANLPLVDPAQMMMMGGLPGPIILPPGGLMGGLPGGLSSQMMMMGGLSGPIILPPGGLMGGGPPGGRGGFGGRGPGGRGRGGRGLKNYYDLDAPANNRAVLDYGDL